MQENVYHIKAELKMSDSLLLLLLLLLILRERIKAA